ncbi:hypothetical protein [Magnetospirillum sp. ME-1]|uniref:hypothetical protein n=1 Tax=Magnetospirillum sp. ME-1 TaxID=1639348 RepID=UPI001F44B45D|nr:hypothetical protein [Magnetospirillum sp. ME-1]
MFLDQAAGVLVADRDRCRTLETLLRVEQIKPCVAAFVDPETFHGQDGALTPTDPPYVTGTNSAARYEQRVLAESRYSTIIHDTISSAQHPSVKSQSVMKRMEWRPVFYVPFYVDMSVYIILYASCVFTFLVTVRLRPM